MGRGHYIGYSGRSARMGVERPLISTWRGNCIVSQNVSVEQNYPARYFMKIACEPRMPIVYGT